MQRLALALAAAILSTPGHVAADVIDGGNFGSVEVAVPAGKVKGFTVLFSGDAGWNAADSDALDQLRQRGFLAAGISLPAYRARLAARASSTHPLQCFSADNDVEGLSREVQRQHGVPSYFRPLVGGEGSGGLLAYIALAQAKVNTISGAVSLDPASSLRAPLPPCLLTEAGPGESGPYRPAAIKDLHGSWSVVFDSDATPDEKAALETFRSQGVPLTVDDAVGGHDLLALIPLMANHLPALDASHIAALPLVELPAAQPSKTLAILLSGDGGWRDIDRSIAHVLQEKGISVVGWDSLRYFWSKKTPEQSAADLAGVITTYSAKWGTSRVALIGYSFGADVLPSIYEHLPEPVRGQVDLVSLLGLESRADWEIQVTGWLGAPPSAAATPIAPELDKMPASIIQCYYGSEETQSACRSLLKPPAELIETKGGHHFGQDYAPLANDILAGLKKKDDAAKSPQ